MGDGGFSQQRSVHKDLRAAVKRAIEAGWTGEKGKTKGWMLTSPDGTAHFYVPITTKDGTTAAKRLNKLVADNAPESGRWAPPGMGPSEMEEVEKEVNSRGGTINHGPDPTISCKQCPEEFIDWDGFAEHVNEKHPVAQVEEPHVVEEVVIPRPRPGFHTAVKAIAEARENTASAKMHDMEEAMQETFRPGRAVHQRSTDGTVLTYESSAFMEIVVDGKVIGYKCPVCPYRHAASKGVISHHSGHVASGEVPPVTRGALTREPAHLYPQKIVKGKWVTMKDDIERIIYDLIHARHQGKNENDSIYAQALAKRLMDAGYTIRLVDEVGVTPDEAEILVKIRALLGMGPEAEQALTEARDALVATTQELEQTKVALAETKQLLSEKVGFINTLAGIAQQEVQRP